MLCWPVGCAVLVLSFPLDVPGETGSSIAAETGTRDRVIVRQEKGRGQLTHVGEITSYDAIELVIRVRGRAVPVRVPATRLIKVVPARSAAHRRALQALARSDIASAEAAFQEAIGTATRRWVRRDLLAGLVRCALWEGDYRRAGAHFLALADGNPRSRHLYLAPLDWRTRGTSTPAVSSEARNWRIRDDDMAKLLAASHLLRDTAYAIEAESMLRKLRTSSSRVIRDLAVAQCWRVDLRKQRPNAQQLDNWTRHLNQMPSRFRAGPAFVLGSAHATRRAWQPAASSLLWTSLVGDHDRQLAARATRDAATALLSDNQPAAARTLLRDLQQRFAETPAARELSTSPQPDDSPSRSSSKPAPPAIPPRTRRTES